MKRKISIREVTIIVLSILLYYFFYQLVKHDKIIEKQRKTIDSLQRVIQLKEHVLPFRSLDK